MSRMQRDATGCNNKKILPRAIDLFLCSRNDLSENQRNAIELLLRGFADQEVAAQLGVDRGTVFRWRKTIAMSCCSRCTTRCSTTSIVTS